MNWNAPDIPPLATHLESALRARIDQKTKPPGSLGRLEELALRLGLMQARVDPVLNEPTVVVFAGDHGLAAEGVSPFPAEVTPQMVLNFLAGGAAINVFARQHRLALKVVDAGVAADLPAHPDLLPLKVRPGTRNALHEPALTPAEVAECLARGAAVVEDLARTGTNVVLFGEMGIANTSAAALLVSALLPMPLEAAVGRGAGHDDGGLARKRATLARVQQRHAATVSGPREALAAYGGCEIAMLAGAMLAAASRRMLILVDGFIVTAALVVAARMRPAVLDYGVFAHASAESAHGRVVAALGGRPLLDLGLRLGEGTGAALAWPLVDAAARFLREMATFESAGVSGREEGVRV